MLNISFLNEVVQENFAQFKMKIFNYFCLLSKLTANLIHFDRLPIVYK